MRIYEKQTNRERSNSSISCCRWKQLAPILPCVGSVNLQLVLQITDSGLKIVQMSELTEFIGESVILLLISPLNFSNFSNSKTALHHFKGRNISNSFLIKHIHYSCSGSRSSKWCIIIFQKINLEKRPTNMCFLISLKT